MPELQLAWGETVEIGRVIVELDPDWDHPMESVLMSHPEEVVPFMAKDFDLLDGEENVIHFARDHHGARFEWRGNVTTNRLTLRILATHGAPAAVFRVRCFGTQIA